MNKIPYPPEKKIIILLYYCNQFFHNSSMGLLENKKTTVLVALLIASTAIIGPMIFWIEYGELIQDSTPVMIDMELDNLDEYIGKIVIVQNACLPDFSLQITEDGVIKKEYIPVVSCDTINQSEVNLFLKITPPPFYTLDDIYDRGEASEHGLFIGLLEKSTRALEAGSRRIIENEGYEYDTINTFQLNSHFNIKEQYIELWILLVMLPLGSIMACITYVRHRKKKEFLHEILFGNKGYLVNDKDR